MEFTKSEKTGILIVLMMGTFVTAMTVTVTNTMLPAIIRDLHIPTSTAQWLTSGSTLASGMMIPIAAYLMKRFESKSYFLSAMVIFCVGALIGTVAPNYPLLLIGRLIQAAGCGMLMPFAQVVLMTIYPKEQHGRIIGVYAMGSTFAPVIAPSLAGLVIDYLGWRAVFGFLCIVGILILIMGFVFMRNVTETKNSSFPIKPVIFSSVGFSALLIGLGNLSTNSITSLNTGGLLAIGFVSLLLFVYSQFHTPSPLLNLRIFRIPQFRTAVVMSTLMYMVCMGSGMLMPIFMQSELGFSATTYAVVTLPGSLIMAVVTLFSGRMYDKIGPRPLMIWGCAMLISGSLLGFFFRHGSSLLHIAIVSCLLSSGTGFLNTPATAMGLSNLTGTDRVDGSSILSTLRQIASSLASTFAIVAYSVLSQNQPEKMVGVSGAYACFLGFALLLALLIFWDKGNKEKITTSKLST